MTKTAQPHADDDGQGAIRVPKGVRVLFQGEDGRADDKAEGEHSPEVGRQTGPVNLTIKWSYAEVLPIENGNVLCKGEIEPEECHHQEQDTEVVELTGFRY